MLVCINVKLRVTEKVLVWAFWLWLRCYYMCGTYIWYLQENLTKFQVTWRILKHAHNNPTSSGCNPLLWKYFIICKPDLASLDKRNELISWCRHAGKYAQILHLKFFCLFCFLIASFVTPYILTFREGERNNCFSEIQLVGPKFIETKHFALVNARL